MNSSCTKFLDRLSSAWPGVADVRKETIEYWKPEEPPLTAAFAEVGGRIVMEIDSIPENTLQSMMSQIDDGMASSDDQLGIAVATWMIEAMIGRAAHTDGRLDEILEKFGPLSKSHAEAWIAS